MSQVLVKGKDHRPAWNYGLGTHWSDHDAMTRQLMMLESLRNATEQVRDELKKLNQIFSCSNFTNMPQDVRKIRNRLTRKRRKANGK